MKASRLTIIVSGMLGGDPYQGGATWAVLQYVLGLRELGHRVILIEPIDPRQIRPENKPLAESDNARYFSAVCDAFDLENAAALLLKGTRDSVGLSYARCREAAAEA